MACMLMSRGTSPNQLEIESTAPRCAFTTLNFMARSIDRRRSILTTQRKKLSRRAGQRLPIFLRLRLCSRGKQFENAEVASGRAAYGNIDPHNASTSSGHVAELSQNSCIRQVPAKNFKRAARRGECAGATRTARMRRSAQRSAENANTFARIAGWFNFDSFLEKKQTAPGGC